MTTALAFPDLTLSCEQKIHAVCTRPLTCTCTCHRGTSENRSAT